MRPVSGSRIVKAEYPSSPRAPLRISGASSGTSSSGWSAAPQVSRTQWTGHVPPSAAKWGVCSGCQSWLYATSAPFARASAASRLTIGMMSAPPAR